MHNVEQFVKNFNRTTPYTGLTRVNECLAPYTTFRVGGSAAVYLRPRREDCAQWLPALLTACDRARLPVFILGGGANVVVSDAGYGGVVVHTVNLTSVSHVPPCELSSIIFSAGDTLDYAAESAAQAGLTGMEFLSGMPGTVGGAVWMNARAYGVEMADIAAQVTYLEPGPDGVWRTTTETADKTAFAYKKSPYQGRRTLLLAVSFALRKGDRAEIAARMAAHRRDRTEKGHYRFPSAGSAFKNNPAFGRPTGKIIDELGLCGLSAGGAQIAPWHGNIIINRNNATAADIQTLITIVQQTALNKLGITLEPEILFV